MSGIASVRTVLSAAGRGEAASQSRAAGSRTASTLEQTCLSMKAKWALNKPREIG